MLADLNLNRIKEDENNERNKIVYEGDFNIEKILEM